MSVHDNRRSARLYRHLRFQVKVAVPALYQGHLYGTRRGICVTRVLKRAPKCSANASVVTFPLTAAAFANGTHPVTGTVGTISTLSSGCTKHAPTEHKASDQTGTTHSMDRQVAREVGNLATNRNI